MDARRHEEHAVPAKIVTVLRSGGEYRAEHVERLRQQAETHAPDAEFICLRDDGVGGWPLQHDWPGWWAKLCLFSLPGPVLYMDLDTSIVGDLTPLLRMAAKHDFIALRDFYRPQNMGSGLMAWRGDMRHVLTAFQADAEDVMRTHNRPEKWGDQGFIDPLTADVREHWQDLLPGAVVSWKAHCRNGGIPASARVVCFHGRPRPWEIGQ